MKLRLAKQSGTPVDELAARQFQKDFQTGFDEIIEEHGKTSQETKDALDALDLKLQKKYADALVKSIEFPKSKKAWMRLLDEHGSVMMCTNIESGELYGIIPDMEF